MPALDNRPTGVPPIAQALKLLGRHDVFGRDKAFEGFLTADALLLDATNLFAAGPLPLL